MPIKMVFADGGSKASNKDFTGSFDAGSGTDISSALINKGVQMILPVAGPQTGDVAGVIASTGNKGNVFTFGVDVDQSKVYNSDYFLGSAIKGIYVSNAYALHVLKNGAVHGKFDTFNMALTKDPQSDFNLFTKNLGDKLRASKRYTNDDIDVMLKPTGFAPSSIMPSTIKGEDVYLKAIQFVKDSKVSGALTKGMDITTIPGKAFEEFGGYMEVSNNEK